MRERREQRRACMRVSERGPFQRRVFESADRCATGLQLVLCARGHLRPSGWPTECAKSRCFVRVGGRRAAARHRPATVPPPSRRRRPRRNSSRNQRHCHSIRPTDRPSAIWPFIDGIKNRVGAHRKRVTNECAVVVDATGVGSTNHRIGRSGQTNLVGSRKKSHSLSAGGSKEERREGGVDGTTSCQRRGLTDLDAPSLSTRFGLCRPAGSP